KRINVPVKKRPKGKLLQNGEPQSGRKWSLRINHLMTSLHGRTYEWSSYMGERAVSRKEIIRICSEMKKLDYHCVGTSAGWRRDNCSTWRIQSRHRFSGWFRIYCLGSRKF